MTHKPDRRSDDAALYRPWYRSPEWATTRERQLSDYPLCLMCQQQGRQTLATVCDHVDPRTKRTREGFFGGPFQSLCQPHHDSTKQREERRGYIIGSTMDGLPRDPQHHWARG